MEKITYQTFLSLFKNKWKQGQHVLLAGPTGSGKTNVAQDIREFREYVVILANKKNDETLDSYSKDYKRTDKWPPHYSEQLILFWKKPKNIDDLIGMQKAIYKVMSDIFIVGGWTIYFDDIAFISGTLRMDRQLRMMYTQVRSNNTSLVASVQRPFRVPVEVVSQSSYILLFRTQDERDIERVAQESGQNTYLLKKQAKEIGDYEFLFIQHGKPPIHVEKRIS